jgi:hypothetical protein
MLGGISNFEWKSVKNLVNCNFACNLCSSHWVKHMSAFVKVVEGSLIHNFPFYHLVHFSSKFGRKTRSTRAKPNWADACRATTSWPCSRARLRASRHVGRCRTRMPRQAHDCRSVRRTPLGAYPLPRATPALAARPHVVSPPVRPRPLCRARLPRPNHRTRNINVGHSFAAKAGSRPGYKIQPAVPHARASASAAVRQRMPPPPSSPSCSFPQPWGTLAAFTRNPGSL